MYDRHIKTHVPFSVKKPRSNYGFTSLYLPEPQETQFEPAISFEERRRQAIQEMLEEERRIREEQSTQLTSRTRLPTSSYYDSSDSDEEIESHNISLVKANYNSDSDDSSDEEMIQKYKKRGGKKTIKKCKNKKMKTKKHRKSR